MRHYLIAFLAGALVHAQTLTAPVAATIIDRNGVLVAIPGVRENLHLPVPVALPPDAIGTPLLAASFTGAGGAVKTADELWVFDRQGTLSRTPAPAGGALFSFAADGSLAWVYFPDAQILQTSTGTAIGFTSWGGTVEALGAFDGHLLPALVQTGSQLASITVDLSRRSVTAESYIAGRTPAVFFENGWLTTTDAGLEWTASGQTVKIPVEEPVTDLAIAGAHSVVVNGHWLLTPAHRVLEIPVSLPHVKRRLEAN